MGINFKDIHIDSLIQQSVLENNVKISRIRNFLKCSEEDVTNMYQSKSLDAELRWSKLLEYDFFRLYTQYLILYAPSATVVGKAETKKSKLPQFRKNIYTKELIDFILEQIEYGELTKNDVIERYRIPKTTLYKWIDKYKK
ncbi:transposase [Chryseobacterium aahli]|uniref:transposase n=1 Tax=Chryseobacterium aahli TaxID=1278643 RepID=UPI0021D41040|nr:transposase [Chryseobacterium aahli]